MSNINGIVPKCAAKVNRGFPETGIYFRCGTRGDNPPVPLRGPPPLHREGSFVRNPRRRRAPQAIGSAVEALRTRLQVSSRSKRDRLRRGAATERVSGDASRTLLALPQKTKASPRTIRRPRRRGVPDTLRRCFGLEGQGSSAGHTAPAGLCICTPFKLHSRMQRKIIPPRGRDDFSGVPDTI